MFGLSRVAGSGGKRLERQSPVQSRRLESEFGSLLMAAGIWQDGAIVKSGADEQ